MVYLGPICIKEVVLVSELMILLFVVVVVECDVTLGAVDEEEELLDVEVGPRLKTLVKVLTILPSVVVVVWVVRLGDWLGRSVIVVV